MELLDQVGTDIVLSDVRMPRMDGVALAQHIRSNVPNTPILVMTACAAQDIKALAELRVAVMRKPFILDQLKSQIPKRCLTLRGSLADEFFSFYGDAQR